MWPSNMDKGAYGLEAMIELTLEEYELRFRSLLDSVVGVYSYNPELIEIVWGEAQAYFAGQKSAEEVAKLIQSRVSIYISEQG